MMRNLIGQQLGNYRLMKLLGRGGFAEVYLGEHVRLSTQAAIKVLHAYLSDEQITGFEQEAKTIANLIHSHIVRILDFDVTNGIPFLVMDYCSHGTLRKRHPKGERLPLSTVISYVQQVAEALQYAHDQKIIHRDVKPENMLIGRNGDLLLSDFGLAATAHSTSSMSSQAPLGTIPYMAPERIQAHPRPASDQYALGIVVYEWLCGIRPFEGSYTEIFAKHLMTSPSPLLEKVPTLLPEVEQVVLTALSKDPKLRFASVQAFATALEQASQPVRTKSATCLAKESRTIKQVRAEPSIPILSKATSSKQSRPPTILATPPNPSLRPATGMLHVYQGHANPVLAVAWSPDGNHIASGSGDHTVQVWSAVDRSHVFTYREHSGIVRAVAWSPDGRCIASCSDDRTVRIWNAVGGRYLFKYQMHGGVVNAVAWSPDSKRIASGSWDRTVQVWDAVNGDHICTYRGHSDWVLAVAWSPDGKRIASISYDKTVQVWDAVDGSQISTYRGHADVVWAVAWSPDGKRIASGSRDQTVQVWDAVYGSHVFTYQGHSNVVRAVAWSPDSKCIASGSWDRTVQVWDSVKGDYAFTYRGHSDWVLAVAWSPDDKRIVSGSGDHTVQVWEAS